MAEVLKATATKLSSKNKKYYINSAISLLLMFGFGYLPAPAPITPYGMKLIGILLGLLYAWTFVELIWPSLLGFIALSQTGFMSFNALISAGLGHQTIWGMMFLLITVGVVESEGVSKFIALWFVSRKSVLGKPWRFLFMFFFACFILSAAMSTIPGIIVGWGIVYSLFRQFDYKSGDSFCNYMVFGVFFASLVGQILLPWKIIQLTVLGMLQEASGISLDYIKYLCVSLPVCIVCLLGYVALGKFVFRLDVSRLKAVTIDSFDPEDLKVTKRQKFVLWMLILLVATLLIPSLLPKAWAFTKFLSGLGLAGAATMVLIIMVFVRDGEAPFLKYQAQAAKLPWGCLFLTAILLPFGNALNQPEAGITTFLIEKFGMVFEGCSQTLFILIIMVIGFVATQFMNNQICGAMVFPIAYPFAVQLGVNPVTASVMLIFACIVAMFTPAASPMASLLFGNNEWIKPKEIYKHAIPAAALMILASIAIGVPIATAIFPN